jgi:hypothetical protein
MFRNGFNRRNHICLEMKETDLPLTTCATQKDKNKIDCGQLERQSLAAVLLDTTLQINVYAL